MPAMTVAEAGESSLLTSTIAEPEVLLTDPGAQPADGSWGLTGRWRTAAVAVLVVVVALGVLLRFWTRSALWLDEALTVDIARLPLHSLHAALRQDGAPPLYYVLLHFWMKVFGGSDLAVRSLSGVISVATLPVAWVAGRRFGGRSFAWMTVLLVASAPFAIYYGSEARMYSLVMLLTACGFIALDRSVREPRAGNLLAVAAVTAALLYTQYWAVYLLATVAVWLLWKGWRPKADPARRRGMRASFGALVVGAVTFVPWLPTFVFQSRHTGTPWAAPANFAATINAVTGFTDNQATLSAAGSNQGRLLAVLYLLLAFLGLFGVARDHWHVDLDIRSRRRGRPVAFVVVVTLGIAVAGGLLAGSGFSDRYAAVVFIPFILLVALGATTLADARLRSIVLLVAAVSGLAVGVQNITTQRTEAPNVAAVLAASGKPGDVVAYCPDQLGPAVYRLIGPGRYVQISYPRRTVPDLIDWIDYKQAVRSASPAAFAQRVLALAGTHRIWMVWAPDYQGYGTRCEQIVGDLEVSHAVTNRVLARPAHFYEPMNLTQLTPLTAKPAAASSAGG
jgi:4-amino-4-deoxy-L-arabinose transferase-like glycosyltransferase